MCLLVCSEAVESKLVKLETIDTVIFPPTVSVLWSNHSEETRCKGNYQSTAGSDVLSKFQGSTFTTLL